MKSQKSYIWASQDIRRAIKKGQIIPNNTDDIIVEDKIQPSSYDPTIGNELYIIDSNYHGIFRINQNETVYENLLQLPKRQRIKVNIDKGFELKKGFSYLIPLLDEVVLKKGQHFRSSPKSSMGRLFINTRLISDYSPSFNENHYNFAKDRKIKLWLYIQPLAFNIVITPGKSFNQLRFFNNYAAKLSITELVDYLDKHPILYAPDANGDLKPVKSTVTDGLTIHLNLSGATTEGIVGLRALHNPTPIHLDKKGSYEVEDYFEPLYYNDNVYLHQGEYYLLSSREVLKVPKDISMELRDYSQIGFAGPLHYAGFIDNGFHGDLVFEVRSDEISKAVQVFHNMPVSKFDVFHASIPDKIYGEANNNYQFQIGTKPPKYFKKPDYKYIARNYELLNYDVLSIDKQILETHRGKKTGFEQIGKDQYDEITKSFNKGIIRSRYLSENDDLTLQVVAYFVLLNENNEIFVYQKADSLDKYAEQRLFNKDSIAIGSHFTQKEFDGDVKSMLQDELAKKGLEAQISNPEFIGTIQTSSNDVDRSHFGLVYLTRLESDLEVEKTLVKNYQFEKIINIDSSYIKSHDFESWSKDLIKRLPKILKTV